MLMRTFFNYVIYEFIILLLIQIGIFWYKHPEALGELVENSSDLINNSNELLIKNDNNITITIENAANLLEKSDSLT